VSGCLLNLLARFVRDSPVLCVEVAGRFVSPGISASFGSGPGSSFEKLVSFEYQ